MMKESFGLEITELRLGLPTSVEKNVKKRVFSEVEDEKKGSNVNNDDDSKQKTKNQVVGWPPVCSYRRKNSFNGRESKKMYIKVSLDGAPILRKIDLSTHTSYSDLIMALEKLFGCIGIGGEAMEDAENNSEYVPIYEDKDGDWMLLGDVPWEMFSESCKKLRIMKRSDAKGMGLQTQDLLKGITKESSI
ncbi:hypothetical protein Leryth_006170 [Lithospermum erythrorhizon]|nr:hypothetical protein Leryth_006170 [Lithospermum erythrorhizon]